MTASGGATGTRVQDLGGVWLLDTGHGDGGTVGVYLLPGEGGGYALLEAGPGSSLDGLDAAIAEAGFAQDGLEAVLVSHIHLDHAGAAGALAARTDADVVVHRIGAPHLADPRRLLASARRIYGDALDRLWGAMTPVPAARIRAVEGGERFEAAGRSVRVVASPGHASHHVCYLLDDGSMVTGDAAAIRLSGAPVVRPATPPPETDLETWSESLKRIRAARPERLLLTHFGAVDAVEAHLDAVERLTREWAEAVLEGLRAGETAADLEARIQRLTDRDLAAAGVSGAVADRYRQTSDAAMTVAGLTRYWRRHHPERLGAAS